MAAHIRQNPEILRLTGICEDLYTRLESLSQQVAVLTNRVLELESGDPDGIVAEMNNSESEEQQLGRCPLKDRGELEHQRDLILGFLQTSWSETTAILQAAYSAHSLWEALRKRFGSMRGQYPGLRVLLEHPFELWDFLINSGRYHGDAIELASAMAGVPQMEPRSSWDYFLARDRGANFTAIQFAAMQERRDRISEGKRHRNKGHHFAAADQAISAP